MSRARILVYAEKVRLKRQRGAGQGADGAVVVADGPLHLARRGDGATLCGKSITTFVAVDGQQLDEAQAHACSGCDDAYAGSVPASSGRAGSPRSSP